MSDEARTAARRDPVCGMTPDADTHRRVRHDGIDWPFCSDRCLARFRDDPEAFVDREDPVCGMAVTPAAEHFAKHAGRPFWFCSARCAERFEADPQAFLDGKDAADEAPPAGTRYICPMCEGVEADGPGECPKCGMALEPETPSVATRTEYTCPMHPEVVREEPGDCSAQDFGSCRHA